MREDTMFVIIGETNADATCIEFAKGRGVTDSEY